MVAKDDTVLGSALGPLAGRPDASAFKTQVSDGSEDEPPGQASSSQ